LSTSGPCFSSSTSPPSFFPFLTWFHSFRSLLPVSKKDTIITNHIVMTWSLFFPPQLMQERHLPPLLSPSTFVCVRVVRILFPFLSSFSFPRLCPNQIWSLVLFSFFPFPPFNQINSPLLSPPCIDCRRYPALPPRRLNV